MEPTARFNVEAGRICSRLNALRFDCAQALAIEDMIRLEKIRDRSIPRVFALFVASWFSLSSFFHPYRNDGWRRAPLCTGV